MQAVGGRLTRSSTSCSPWARHRTTSPTCVTVWRPSHSDSVDCRPVALDAMLENDGTAMLRVPFSNYGQGNLDGTRNFTHPYTVPAQLTAAHTSAHL